MTSNTWEFWNSNIWLARQFYLRTGSKGLLKAVLLTGEAVILTPEEAKLLFEWIDGGGKLPKGGAPMAFLLAKGFPKELPWLEAERLFDELREEVRAAGYHLTRDQAVKVVAWDFARYGVTEETLRNWLRTRNRRKSGR